MRVAVTGTPGTGKTTVTERLEADGLFDSAGAALDVVHLGSVIEREGLYTGRDERRDSYVADLDAIEAWLGDRDDLLLDSHLAHLLDVDRVAVLRCHPTELERRLRERGVPEEKVRENAESEALDVILSEAVEEHGLDAVYEIDTTDRSPAAIADDVRDVVTGERAPSAGTVDFVEYLGEGDPSVDDLVENDLAEDDPDVGDLVGGDLGDEDRIEDDDTDFHR